jgi:hypothetical protein
MITRSVKPAPTEVNGTRQPMEGGSPMLDAAKNVDMRKAAAYIAGLGERVLLPGRERRALLFKRLAEEVEDSYGGRGSKALSELRKALVDEMNRVRDVLGEEKSRLVGGDFEAERAAHSNFVHYVNASLSPLLSNFDTLIKRIESGSDKAPIAAEMAIRSARQAGELFEILGEIKAADEKSASLLFSALGMAGLISALHKAMPREFDGKLAVRGEQYNDGVKLHEGEKARAYLADALAFAITANREIREEKKEMLDLLEKIDGGHEVWQEFRGVVLRIKQKALGCTDTSQYGEAARSWAFVHYIVNNAAALSSANEAGMPSYIISGRARDLRTFLALLDRLRQDSFYEMKTLLESQTLEDAVQRLC